MSGFQYEDEEEDERRARRPAAGRRRGAKEEALLPLLRHDSMQSVEDGGGDPNAVMTLLLQELVAINKARAQRKKQMQQSVRCSIRTLKFLLRIFTSSYYMRVNDRNPSRRPWIK